MNNMNQQFNGFDELQRQLQEREREVHALKAQLHLASQNHTQSSFASQQSHYPVEHSDFPVDFVNVPRNVPAQQYAVRSVGKVQRSKSTMGHAPSSMSSGRPMDQSSERQHPVKRPRVMSQQYTPSPSMTTGMSRSGSSQSSRNVPFIAAGPIAPLQSSNTAHTPHSGFTQARDGSSSNYGFATPLQRATTTQRRSFLQSVEEHSSLDGVGIHPLAYLEAHETTDAVASSNPRPPPAQNYALSHSNRGSGSSLMMSACPSMTSGPSAAESAALTRDNSSFDNSLVGAFDMARLDSTHSQQTDLSLDQDFYASFQDDTCDKSGDPMPYLGDGFPDPLSQDYSTSAHSEQFLSQESIGMERSNSSTSTQSSVERRAREARRRHNQNATRLLAAKPKAVIKSSPAQASKKDGKVAMTKSGPYTRPKHPKVKCTMCDDNPQGFRGEHELKRHVEAKHAGVVKKFICRDPALSGIPTAVQALHPLSKCKQCKAKKQYGAYYNAAAHLRRTHFKPKVARGKKARGDDEEKRGGKGGGDWPPMNELKAWFEEVYVHSSETNDADEEDDDNEAANTAMTAIDMTFAGIGNKLPQEPDFPGYSMGPELSLDTTSTDQPTLMSAPTFEFSPYATLSPMGMIPSDATFSAMNALTSANCANQMSQGFMVNEYVPFQFDMSGAV
ncbi:hypothetical protein BN1723_007017 [Verticillium longisporum]|uniref:DUF7896 domain-containing protein n=1 Tax=Verticillium longisporum TaxID=100787 RepID=A0A0G4NIV2_VERLO|nr:hypothetical protein BN1723_007017 [Verticillium longisporum]